MNGEYSERLGIDEDLIIDSVAKEYTLDDEGRRLLYAIRKSENGAAGREFGVLTEKAMRFKDDPYMSMVTQARHAAGTIKLRYRGDVDAFSARWAPVGAANDPTGLNRNLPGNLKYFMNLKKELEDGVDKR